MAYNPQINQLRSLDYRANLLLGQGRFKEAEKALDELLPLYDWFTQNGQDPKRIVNKDRKHYEILKFQCGEKHRQSQTSAQDWVREIDAHILAARAQLKSDLRSSANTVTRLMDMVQKKEAPTDIKTEQMAKVQSLAAEVKKEAWALGEQARNIIFTDGPGACTRYEIAIEVMRKFDMKVKAKELEEELGSAVYVSQTGSRLQDVQDRLKQADKAEDVERLMAEMERMKSDIQSQSQSSTQGQQMQMYLSKILSEVEATKQAASQQKQIVIAQNVRFGDDITIRDSVVQRSQIGGGGAGGPVVAGESHSGSKINVDNSVIMRSDLGGTQKVETDVALKEKRAPTPQGPTKAFNACPYCGEKLNLPKTPKFCPFCSEQLVQ